MPTVAEQLRHGREQLKLDVHQVASVTKLKTDQIRALEEGNYDYFTAPVYLRGSIRTYAGLLKLDSVQLIAQLETELGSGSSPGEPAAEDPPARRRGGVDALMLVLSRLNWGIAGLIIAVAVIALVLNSSYRAWKKHTPADALEELSAGMYTPPEPAGELLPLPTNAPSTNP
jgi:cytoskeletal protein RodZ